MNARQLPRAAMAVAIVAGSVLLGWQYHVNCRLCQELTQLRDENNRLGLDREERARHGASNTTIGELEQLRAAHSELLRLRGQVGLLRGKIAELEHSAQQGTEAAGTQQQKPADEQAEEVRKQELMATAADIRTRLKDLAEQRKRLAEGLQRTRPKRPQGAAELQLLQGFSPDEVEALGKDPAKLKSLMESPQAQELRETAKSSSVLDAQIAQMSALEQALTNRLKEVEAALNSAPSGNGRRNIQTAPR